MTLTRAFASFAAVAMLAATVAPVAPQSALSDDCIAAAGAAHGATCERAVESLESALVRFTLAASGGNPTPGSSSTIGFRIGATPRIAAAARFTVVRLATARFGAGGASSDGSQWVSSIALDGTVGVFEGFSPFSTVGGLASVDAIASAGLVLEPDTPFGGQSGFTTGLGIRVGVLRESFTAPGISLSVMYRWLDSISFRSGPAGARVEFSARDPSAWSYRGVVGKRVGALGLSVGAGVDRPSADATLSLEAGGGTQASESGLGVKRWTAFGSVVWTQLVINLSAELGWQQGGEVRGTGPSAQVFSDSGLFASFAIRLVF